MSTTVEAGHGLQPGTNRRAMRIWLRLFLGISGAAVAIAVTLGLVVVLAAAASQAQASPLPGGHHGQLVRPVSAAAPASAPASAPAASAAVVQLAAGTVLLGLGFGCLLSRRGSRLLAGGAAAEGR